MAQISLMRSCKHRKSSSKACTRSLPNHAVPCLFSNLPSWHNPMLSLGHACMAPCILMSSRVAQAKTEMAQNLPALLLVCMFFQITPPRDLFGISEHGGRQKHWLD